MQSMLQSVSLAMTMLIISQCVTLAAPQSTPGITLINGGQSQYDIVIPDKPLPVHQYAAEELQSFLEQMSGVSLPIVAEKKHADNPGIFLGACRRGRQVVPRRELRDLSEDGVLIRTAGQDLVLSGKNERGELYVVYELLERFLGVRFLAGDCNVVPQQRTVTLPKLNHRHSPPFMYRETLYFDSFPKAIAARQRLNGPNIQADASIGGKITFFPYVHSFSRLLPPAEFYETHPEYFSLVNGQRTKETVHGQLCLSNLEVKRIIVERVLQWAKDHPEATILDVSQNDGNGACECPDCMAIVNEEGSQHGPILRVVNAVADAMAQQYPDRWVETLAYAYAMKPGAITMPRENVLIRLCHAGCYFHGFEACGLGANLSAYLNEWHQRTERIFIWHYATNFAHYLAPNQNLQGLAKDIKYYAANGVNGLMIQGDYQSPGGELAEIRQYLSAQLMWDPDRDAMQLREEFCKGYYGNVAEDFMKFLALHDSEAARPDVHAFGAWDPVNNVRPEFIVEGLKILTAARAKAAIPEVKNRVEKAMLPFWYMQLSHPELYALSPTDAPKILDDLERTVITNKVTHFCEGGENMPGWIAAMRERVGQSTE